MGVDLQKRKALALNPYECLIINLFIASPLKAVLNWILWMPGHVDTMNTMQLRLDN